MPRNRRTQRDRECLPLVCRYQWLLDKEVDGWLVLVPVDKDTSDRLACHLPLNFSASLLQFKDSGGGIVDLRVCSRRSRGVTTFQSHDKEPIELVFTEDSSIVCLYLYGICLEYTFLL